MNQFKDAFLGKGAARVSTRGDVTEVHARQWEAQRSQQRGTVAATSHVLRDAGELFVRRLLSKPRRSRFAWELLTDVWSIPPDRLYATVFKGEAGIPRDDDAYQVWDGLIPRERIVELGLAENFWAMGDTGPCGRCSEIHYHRGDHLPCAGAKAVAVSTAAATAMWRS